MTAITDYIKPEKFKILNNYSKTSSKTSAEVTDYIKTEKFKALNNYFKTSNEVLTAVTDFTKSEKFKIQYIVVDEKLKMLISYSKT